MKKKKTMLAVAAAAALSIMLSSVPKAWADPNVAYRTTLSSGIEANSTGKYKSKNSDGTYAPFTEAVPASQNTTVVKKILIIEDDATVPAATFNITASAGEAIPLAANDTTHLAVKAGMNPQLITWKSVAATDNKTFSNIANVIATGTSADTSTSTAPVTFTATSVTSGVTDANIENGVTLSTADTSLVVSKGENGNYYAEKELQLDFSACAFTEPGVYRYILTEAQANTNVGITDDTNLTRTVDVYVEDASYYARSGTEAPYTYTLTPELRIAGYVMYVGTVGTAPLKASTTDEAGSPQLLEDGTSTSPTTGHPTGAAATKGGNGDDANKPAEKSVGFKNTYKTNKLKITKTVTGNQGSRDQYFKFTLKSDTASIPNDAVFYVSATESNLSTTLSGDNAPNSATNSTYTSNTIKTANTFPNSITGLDANKILGTFTGEKLKSDEGIVFYLQHDQYITVTGLPTGINYTVTEIGEDYKVSYTAATGTDNITKDTKATGDTEYTGDSITASNQTGSVEAKDTLLRADAQVDFTNTKEGVIPTGVILSVAAPVIIGIIAAAGIIAIFMRKRRKAE